MHRHADTESLNADVRLSRFPYLESYLCEHRLYVSYHDDSPQLARFMAGHKAFEQNEYAHPISTSQQLHHDG